MDNEEAKFILRAYRPSGVDAGEAAFCASLEQAKRDPALGAWFEREQAHDRAMTEKMRGVAVPAGLRDAILAGGKMSARSTRVWWSQPRWMALAASVMLLIGLAVSWPRLAATRAEKRFGEFAMNDMLHVPSHAAHGPGMGQLAALVSDPQRKLGGGLPIDFEALRANGCRTLSFAGRDVLEVCFTRDGGDYHVYVMKKTGDMRAVREGPLFAREDGATSAVWSDDAHVYALVGSRGAESLRALL